MVLAREVLEGEADGDRLLVERGRFVGSVRFPGRGARLGAEHVLDSSQVQQVAVRSCVEEELRLQYVVGAGLEVFHLYRRDAIAVRPCSDGPIWAQHEQSARELVGRQHLVEHCDRDPGIVAEAADPSVSRVEERIRSRTRSERKMQPVVVADPIPERSVAGARRELLDPWVLVRRDRLVRELTAQPVRFLGEDHGPPEARGGERRRAGPEASADDRDVGAARCQAQGDIPPHDRYPSPRPPAPRPLLGNVGSSRPTACRDTGASRSIGIGLTIVDESTEMTSNTVCGSAAGPR